MTWQFSVYLVPLVLAALVTFTLAAFAFRKWHKRTAPQVFAILIASCIWAGADAMRLASTTESAMAFWHNVRFVGSTLLVLGVITFVLEYTNRERWLTRRRVLALATPFAITVVLTWTNEYHGLMRTGITLVEQESLLIGEIDLGTWFYVNAAYSYVLLAITFVLGFVELLRAQSVTHRRQLVALLSSLTVPWVLNAFFIAEVTLIDLTPAGLAVTGAMFFISMFWFELLDLVPIARRTVVDNIEHGFLVVDTEGRIVDVNEVIEQILGADRESLIGVTVDRLFTDYPEIMERFGGSTDVREEIAVDTGDGERFYDVDISPVYDKNDRLVGRVVLVRDVTERHHREEKLHRRTAQLERKNEELDQFASIVSHDLRNPINVADGYLQIAKGKVDSDVVADLEEVEVSHDRMQEIIDDVLALARQSRDLTEPKPVELAEIVEVAWNTVDAPNGTLVLETNATIQSDPSRLRQLFENLMRNVFDHGPEGATITVGDLPDGFYLEDDGPGIPQNEREEVLEQGFTTHQDGTGLGLSIVSAVAEAHDWSIQVTEGKAGGARFEFTGVDRSDGEEDVEPGGGSGDEVESEAESADDRSVPSDP